MGNITAGLDFLFVVWKVLKQKPGLTIPLMLKSDGTKFGKSAGNAIWLDPENNTL